MDEVPLMFDLPLTRENVHYLCSELHSIRTKASSDVMFQRMTIPKEKPPKDIVGKVGGEEKEERRKLEEEH